MRKLITYNRLQYEPLKDRFRKEGLGVVSILELHGNDHGGELLDEGAVVDVSRFVPLFSGNPPLASNFELVIHLMPDDVIFIGDEDEISGGTYSLRTIFDTFENCGIEVDEDMKTNEKEKRTLVSLPEDEFASVLATLKKELIGQNPFKRAFESQARNFRLFNVLGEQPILSLLLLGPSGVGKTEVARILSGAIAPGQPLSKINLGNYSSKDSLNSLIGSPRGYMGSEEGELSKKVDSTDAGVLLVDEFEKAEPAVWNFFLDLLETGSFTDSLGVAHDLAGYIIVFTTNCPCDKLDDTFPNELLSRFNMKVHFSKLSTDEKSDFVRRYLNRVAEKYRDLGGQSLPPLPSNLADKAIAEIDVDKTDNIRILKNQTRSWLCSFVDKARKPSGPELRDSLAT